MEGLIDSIDSNQLEQLFILRRHFLPHEQDDEQNLARAGWLYKSQRENLENIITNAVCKAFGGK
ncbi:MULTISPECIES: DUF6890 family protein [unclassified Pseudoalteromonas]|uniref:DUF6890 family protein n=1 Tax=unclassified Pseudoalteromonas TaxID=194690 RepID=UPI003857181B